LVDRCLFFFFWRLRCLSFDLRILISPLVSTNSSFLLFFNSRFLIIPLVSSIETKISNVVRPMSFWNNLYQVGSKIQAVLGTICQKHYAVEEVISCLNRKNIQPSKSKHNILLHSIYRFSILTIHLDVLKYYFRYI
jgi:hypothetical protein